MQYLIKKSTHAVALTAGLVTLAACSAEQGIGNSFFQEAGTQIDPGEFGNATLHNQLVQTCRTNSASYQGKVGGVSGDPVVVLDPTSSANRPVYRVHCDGRLDGKYALVIYNEYITSAAEDPTVTDAEVGDSGE